MAIVISAILAYLIGSISTSTIITRLVAKTDIRNHGSGNAGATNTLRVLGTKWGVVVLLIDALKGVVAVLLAEALLHGLTNGVYLAALAVIAGHNWPVFFGFRGGKGMATTIGVFLSLHTIIVPALLAGIIAIIVLLTTRYVSLASLLLAVLTPLAAIVFGRPIITTLFAAVVAAFSLWRHRQNVGRLLRGQEHRIFDRSS